MFCVLSVGKPRTNEQLTLLKQGTNYKYKIMVSKHASKVYEHLYSQWSMWQSCKCDSDFKWRISYLNSMKTDCHTV